MGTGDRTILLVEDDPELRSMIAEVLDGEGYHTVGVASGKDGLAHLKASPAVALILLDLMMPGMDGWQFRREQVAEPAAAGVPVVVVSAVWDAEAQAAALGAAGCLRKPFDLSDLLATVQRILADRGEREASAQPGA